MSQEHIIISETPIPGYGCQAVNSGIACREEIKRLLSIYPHRQYYIFKLHSVAALGEQPVVYKAAHELPDGDLAEAVEGAFK